MKPICVKCLLFMRPKRNGVHLVEGMPTGDPADPTWQPYKLWEADLWACRQCGTEIIVGAGAQPISEHYRDDWDAAVAGSPPEYTINDC